MSKGGRVLEALKCLKTFGGHVKKEDGAHGERNFCREKHSAYPVRSKFFDSDPLISSPIMCGFPDLSAGGSSVFEQAKTMHQDGRLPAWVDRGR